MIKFLEFTLLAAMLQESLVYSQVEALAFTNKDNFIYIGSYKKGSNLIREDVMVSSLARVPNPKSHYFLSVNSADWVSAQADCKAFLGENATLVYLETLEEYETLEKFVKESDATISSFWVGGTYSVETGGFMWANGIPFGDFTPWDNGQPDTHERVTKVAAFNNDVIRLRTQYQTVNTRYCCELIHMDGNTTNEAKPCFMKNDLLLVIDASWSINAEEFKVALVFSKKLTRAWLADGNNRVAVLIFSSSVVTLFSLEESESLNEMQLTEKIENAPFLHEKTFTHVAMEEALIQFKASNHSNGPCGDDHVPQNAAFITDGRSDYPMETIDAATKLLGFGIQIFSIGYGNIVNATELLAMTGNISERVFLVDNEKSGDLLAILGSVSTTICNTKEECYAL